MFSYLKSLIFSEIIMKVCKIDRFDAGNTKCEKQAIMHIRSNETVIWSVYEVKWILFKLIFCHLKILACPRPFLCSIPHVRAFKWGTIWHSTSRGIRTSRSLSQKLPKSLLFFSRVEKVNKVKKSNTNLLLRWIPGVFITPGTYHF